MKSRKPTMSKGRLYIPRCDNSPLDYVRQFDEMNHFVKATYHWRFS